MRMEKANFQTVSPFFLPLDQLGRGSLGGKVAGEGGAGLQTTAQPGERGLRSFYVSRGRLLAWFDCVGGIRVIFHLGHDV